MLKAGVSITDISPKKGVRLMGYPHVDRYNKGVHDPLYAACLYLNNGKDEVILVTMDILYFGKEYVKQLREKFGKHIMFSASHTHCGPYAYHKLSLEPLEDELDKEYIASLLVKLESLIQEAINNTFPAKIGSEIGRCGAEQGVGGNRREKAGVCDPSVNVIAVKDLKDEVRACYVNYSLHPTFLHDENDLVTADYPAYIRRYLSFAYPKAITLFAQGASGNQSSRYHRVGQDFEEAARVGTTIGVEVFHCLQKISYTDQVELTQKSKEIDLPTKEFPSLLETEALVNETKAKLESLKDAPYIVRRNAELAWFGAEGALNFLKIKEKGIISKELPYEIQMITINDTLIVAVQGELFVEFGLEIKRDSPYPKTIFNELTNGALIGYIYTKEAVEEGGYEVGNSMLAPHTGETVVHAIKSMLV